MEQIPYIWMSNIEFKKILESIMVRIKNHDIKNNKMEMGTCILAIVIFLYALNILEMLIITALTLGYPMVKTYYLMKTDDLNKVNDLLTYWIFYSSFTICETLLWFILKFVPIYDTIKIFFMLWAVLPQTNGHKYIYTKYIAPLLEKYNYDKFNKLFTIVSTKVSEGINDIKKINIDNEEKIE